MAVNMFDINGLPAVQAASGRAGMGKARVVFQGAWKYIEIQVERSQKNPSL